MAAILVRKATSTAPTQPNTGSAKHHYSVWGDFIARFKAKRQARKIMRSLDEVEQIKSGRKQAKSFDDFLNDF